MAKQKKQQNYNKKSLTGKILEIFFENQSKIYNYKQLAAMLNVKDFGKRQLIIEILAELTVYENLLEPERGKYKLKPRSGYIQGAVDLTSKGYAFIKTDEMPEDVFVSQSNLRHALNGDLVKVYLYARKKSFHPEGEVVEIIKRAKDSFVGTIEMSPHFAFLVPSSRNMPYDIFIPLGSLNGAKNGQKAIAKITDWPVKAKNPTGEVIDVLGYAGENNTEMHAILAEFDLPIRFPEEVNYEAQKIKEQITQFDEMTRKDFRKITTFTIDPADAKDFDDAISLQKLPNGNWEVGVHIADVTHYVQESSLVEKEAKERATSVYLVDRVVPMLPERLSNNICSLRPDEDKLCFAAVFEMNDTSEILNEWFGRTIINSDKRFTYEEAQVIIETETGILSNELKVLNKLANKLKQERFRKGAFAFERDEVKFNIDEKGKPLNVYFKIPKEANFLVEEFMLLANKKVAELIGKPKDRKPPKTFVYRIHDKPDPEKFASFSSFIRKFGYHMSQASGKAIAKSMNSLLHEIRGKKEQNIIETLAVRSMAKAVYSTKNIGHYGLAYSHYTHFTSPIRRYPDMLVHRLLAAYLKGENSKDQKKYEQLCEHSSEMEKRAADAERASIKYKQVEFMSDKIGMIFDGIISGVAEWGFYVEIIENKCEGLVPIRDMQGDFYIFDEDNYCITGKRSGKKFQLGDPVKVEILSANLVKKQLDYRLVE
ncbi:MAG: ribonuclease R [Bacteroidota bacterium]